MVTKRTSQPTDTDILSTTNLKTFLRVDSSAEDTLIAEIWKSARIAAENYTNCWFGDCTAIVYLDSFCGEVILDHGPLVSVSQIQYYDSSNTLQTLSTDYYYTDTTTMGGRIVFTQDPATYDRPNAVQISCTLGYAEADVPADVVSAMKLMAGHLYENRQQEIVGAITANLKTGFEYLLNPYRLIRFA